MLNIKTIDMKTQRILPVLATVILTGAMFLAGCEKEKKTSDDITNVKWHLTKFVDVANHKEDVPGPADNTHYFWIKLCNDTLQGFGQVNEMAGCYTISGSKIHIYNFGCTKICPLDSYENDFFSAIKKADSFKTDGKILLIYYDGDKKYLQFEKVNN